jgi:hypothetical protein
MTTEAKFGFLFDKFHLVVNCVSENCTQKCLLNYIRINVQLLLVREQSAEEHICTKDGLSDRGSRKLHNEKLHNLYSSLSTIRMIKLRRMRWAGRVVYMGRRGMPIGFWWESRKETDH